jgi:hypothetical protein
MLATMTQERPPGTLQRSCAECGAPFYVSARYAHAQCCSTLCRKSFNNRRMTRGALLYDLFMTSRYERKLAKKLKLWRMICRLAMDFRREDRDQRAGRKSWGDAREVIRQRPYLHAVVVTDNAAGVRRRPS